MARVALQVPAELVGCIRDTALLLYQAAVEALHRALGAHEAGASLEEVRRVRARLTELGGILDQVGWPGEPVPHQLELAGPRDVLRDALHGSLIDSGERLAVACGGTWRGEASADSVRVAAGEVIALDRLLRELEASASR
ncbi:MAG: hypothetical protein QOD71_2939 [Thermoleophilaceae bacterium]|jgi:hypothetical protein|nr:hypothetical protein [Thermoleophilaceae bacterium]